jgi:hypothetical protein
VLDYSLGRNRRERLHAMVLVDDRPLEPVDLLLNALDGGEQFREESQDSRAHWGGPLDRSWLRS